MMKLTGNLSLPRLAACIALAAACGLPTPSAFAQSSGVWTGAGGDGLWTGDSANWLNNIIASGSGATADFSQVDLTANTTVHLDAPVTIGNLIFGNTDANPAKNWVVDANGNPNNILTLAGGTSTITVTNLGSGKVVMTNVIAGASGLVKDGPGVLELDNAETYTNGTTIKSGTLILGLNIAAGEQIATDPYTLGVAGGGPATLLVNMVGHNLLNPINLATNAVGPLSLGNYGAQKADFFGNIALNGNNLIFTNGADNTSNGRFLVSDTVSGIGNITFINNSPAGNVTAGTINNTGSVTLGGTSTISGTSYGYNMTFGANVTAINYVGPATVAAFTAPANPKGLTINSSSSVNLGMVTLAAGLSNLTLNANSSGSIIIGVMPVTVKGVIQNSGTGSGPVLITNILAATAGVTNIIQNSATSPLLLTAPNTYSNTISVESGTLLVNGAGTNGLITVYPGGTLGGVGTLGKLLTVQAGGTLAPGTNMPTAVGTLTLKALSLSGNLAFKLSKNGGVLTNDYVAGTTLLTNLGNGILTLTNIGSTPLANGDKFTLFGGPLLGGNTITIVSSLGIFTNNLAVDGSITAGDPAPTITSVSPGVGSSGGGTSVTITGTGFSQGLTVSFGGLAGTAVSVTGSTSISVRTPAHAAGTVLVAVVNPDGLSATNSFSFVSVPAPAVTGVSPATGPTVGGTTVTLTGSNFFSGDTVQFGAGTPVLATVTSSTSLTVTAPAHAAGAVNILVTDANSQSSLLPGGYTYVAPTPAVWVAPDGGGDGLWAGDPANWSNNIVADGVDQTADFSQGDFNYYQYVHVDTNIVVGNMIFGTTQNVPVYWNLDNNGTPANTLTLATAADAPTITVEDPSALGSSVTIDAVLGGTNGFTLTGGGLLTLGSADGTITNTLSGGMTIANGSLFINNFAGGISSNNPVTLGSTNIGSSATLYLAGAAFANPIMLASGAQGTLTISGDENGPYHPVLTGPMINLNSNNLTFVAPFGSVGSSYFLNGVTGTGNLTLEQDGSGTVLNKGTFDNLGSLNLVGAGTGTFSLGTLTASITNFNYESSSASITIAPTINVSPGGTTINSSSPLNLPATGGLTIGAGGKNLTLNADNTGNILISGVSYQLGGSIVNSGSGSGTTTISAGIFNNSGISNIIQNSATSPLILSGANYYTVPTLVSNGTLLVNGPVTTGQKGSPITVASGGTLGGTGSIGNLVTVQAGGTLAPGTNDGLTIGTLTLTNGGSFIGGLSLSGNLLFKLNNGGGQSNDMVVGSTLLTNLGSGTLTLVNVGPPLNGGDTFQLFNHPLINGNLLTIIGPTNFINNLAVDGTVTVGTASAVPAVGTASLQGANLSVVWQGGANQNCVVLSTTNLLNPLAQWTPVATNAVGASGLSTNVFPVTSGAPQQFYDLVVP